MDFASLMDTSTGYPVPGYSNVSFPISLAGVDTTTTSNMKLRIHMGTNNEEETPASQKSTSVVRVLNSLALENNGWEFSPSVSLIDGLHECHRSSWNYFDGLSRLFKADKSVGLSGNFSSGLTITFTGPNGGTLGTASQGGLSFISSTRVRSINLDTYKWLDREIVLTANFAEPALNPDIDVVGDDTHEWSFSFGDDYGHYGWQSLLSGLGNSVTSTTVNLDGSNPASMTFRIPVSSSTLGNSCCFSDADSFESPVTVSIGSGISDKHRCKPTILQCTGQCTIACD